MLIDTHAHLTAPQFDKDLDEVIKRAVENDVQIITNIGTDIKTSQECIQLSEKYESLYSTVGLHPEDAIEAEDLDIDSAINKFRELASHAKVLAIGEIGMDLPWIDYLIEKKKIQNPEEFRQQSLQVQTEVFKRQLDLALEINLPAAVHSRAADEQMFELLKTYSNNGGRGVLHSFTGNADFMMHFVEKGWYVSFNGIVTFKNGENVRELCSKVPVENIIIETDAPYLAPEPHRGKLCESAFIDRTYEKVANIKGMDYKEMIEIVESNVRNLFQRLG